MIRFALTLLLITSLFSCQSDLQEVIEERWEDGSPRIVRTYAPSADTLIIVKELSYYPNGQVRLKGSFLEGERHGHWVYYYDNGKRWSEGHYVNGLEDKKRRVWHHNGQLNYEGMFRMGKKVGVWRFFDEHGNLITEEDYGK